MDRKGLKRALSVDRRGEPSRLLTLIPTYQLRADPDVSTQWVLLLDGATMQAVQGFRVRGAPGYILLQALIQRSRAYTRLVK